jgi:hypothetical protein
VGSCRVSDAGAKPLLTALQVVPMNALLMLVVIAALVAIWAS